VKYNDIAKFSNGAQFYTADLHIHTFGGSHDVKDQGMTPEAVIDEGIKLGVGVLAITDHNTSKNTERSLEHAQKYAGQLLVLAGVEVTTANGHLLVYFAPTASHQLNSFIGKIGIVKAGTAESHTTMSMSDVATEAMRLGGVCIAAHIDRDKNGFEMLAKGYPNWKKDIITNPGILGVEVDDPANLAWYSADDLVTPEGAERRKLIELRAKTPGVGGRATLAHLQNSDAHNLKGLVDAFQKRALTRLKMESLTFDGFRTALLDSDARVRATATVPPMVPRVLGMHVDGGFLHAGTYRLSDNLTCFIGGRGTGKSSALKCLAYGLGTNSQITDYDNCPDTVVVYCRDAHGITYRYERMRGSEEPSVQAHEKGGAAVDVPADVFRVEFYGQGDLARVAEDPLARADLFQGFLDRHAHLADLDEREAELIEKLEHNGSQLRPLEAQEGGRAKKTAEFDECKKKLDLAEEGQLKAIAASQAAIGAEKGLTTTLDGFRAFYQRGISLNDFRRNYETTAAGAGKTTDDPESTQRLAAIKTIIDETNASLAMHETQLLGLLRDAAKKLDVELKALAANHKKLELANSQQVADFQKAGLSASVADHQKVVARRGVLAQSVAQLDQKLAELKRLRAERQDLRKDLDAVRAERTSRRKDQVKKINKHLATVIDDYTVAVYYDDAGLAGAFVKFISDAMRGTYFQDDVARRLCAITTPQELAHLVASGNAAELSKLAGLGDDWAKRLLERLSPLETLHELEITAKPGKPVIKVMTKGSPPKQIPVNQLSDGQKHTILLTIAMLADSEVPLLIDQPEDDLDNAFIFTSVVKMLREVKERRQVIVVTHNANIAVLGDAELLFPMRRSGDLGSSFDSGSIDKGETKRAVQSILEGGEIAFLRRKEIYGH
jgi:hypothetical protein